MIVPRFGLTVSQEAAPSDDRATARSLPPSLPTSNALSPAAPERSAMERVAGSAPSRGTGSATPANLTPATPVASGMFAASLVIRRAPPRVPAPVGFQATRIGTLAPAAIHSGRP